VKRTDRLAELISMAQKHIPKNSDTTIEIGSKKEVTIHSDILRMELYAYPEDLQEAIDIIERLRKIHTGLIF